MMVNASLPTRTPFHGKRYLSHPFHVELVSGRFSMVRSRRWWNPKVRSKNMKLKSKDQQHPHHPHPKQLVFWRMQHDSSRRIFWSQALNIPVGPIFFSWQMSIQDKSWRSKGKNTSWWLAATQLTSQRSNFSGVRRLDHHGLTVSQKSPCW